MILKVSLIVLMANAAMSSAPQSVYYTYPATTTTVLNKQPYPLYQTFIRQPSYQLPVYQQQNYQYQPTVVKQPIYQVQPSTIVTQPLPTYQADTRKIVLQERPAPSQEVTHRPNYSFAYAVDDEKSGDQKSHQESRDGDNVIGKYTVVEPDGTLRIVTYTAGKEGFNAIVERKPPVKQLVPQKPLTVVQQIPARKIVAAQSQPFLFRPIVQAQAIASSAPTLSFGNYYYN